MKIQVIGSGCPTCKALHQQILSVVQELDESPEVEYVVGIDKLVELGIMQSPALVIDGKPILTGYTNNSEKLKKIILSYLEKDK